MKRIIGNLILFILSMTLFCCIYMGLFKVSVTSILILLAFFALYACCMGLGWKSLEELKKYEKKQVRVGLVEEDYLKILLFCLTSLMPTYFCVFLVSLVPLFTYSIWFITVFPAILLNCLPASSILDEYYCLTHKKAPLLIIFISLTLACCLVGVVTINLITSAVRQ